MEDKEELINDLDNSVSQLEKDLKYIKNEIIAKQKNGKYCKVSRILKCVVVYGTTQEQYTNYWMGTYKKRPITEQEAIKKAIKYKFESDLTPLESIIKIEENSKDTDKEKKKIIKEITSELSKTNSSSDEDDETDLEN